MQRARRLLPTVTMLAFLLAGSVSPVRAHLLDAMIGSEGEASRLWYPEVAVQALAVMVLYLLVIDPLRKRYGWGEPVDGRRIGWFTLGVFSFYLAEGTPLHALSEQYLFSAHMLQHFLLMTVMPALLILGCPPWLLRRVFLSYGPVAKFFRWLVRPLIAFLVFNAVFIIWHHPVLYQAALYNHDIHILEHIFFIAAGAVMWWPIISPLPESPRLSEAGQIVYIALLGAAQIAVFGPITFLDETVYVFYEGAPRLWGIGPIVDQQLAGIIMKLPTMAIYVGVLTVNFFRWAAKAEGRPQRRPVQSDS